MKFHCLLFSVNDRVIDRTAGVHRIAHHLRLQGWDAEVIDFTDYWNMDELQALARSRITSDTKFIGFSYLFNRTASAGQLKEYVSWLKSQWPHLITISGGQAIVRDSEHLDYHILGYGEYALDALLKYLFSNGERPNFDLTAEAHKNTKIINALHSYPAYPFRDAMIKYEPRDFVVPGEWGRIEFSRGCKFKCKFCNFPVLGVQGDFTRDADSARRQILENHDLWGIKDYLITDETFNDRTEKITKFADMVDTLPWKPYFAGFIRADLLISRPKDREELLRMNMLAHFMGIESFNHESAKAIGKGMHPDKVKEGLIDVKNWFKERVGYRYRGNISFIAGLPYETMESLEKTKAWAKQNWMDQVLNASALEMNSFDDHRRSEMSMNYEKLGYRELDIDTSRFNLDFVPRVGENVPADAEILMINHGAGKSILWENEHMNIFQAYNWANSIEGLYRLGKHDISKVGVFPLSNLLCEADGTPITTDKKLKLIGATSGPYYTNFRVFVENYKNKKLSV